MTNASPAHVVIVPPPYFHGVDRLKAVPPQKVSHTLPSRGSNEENCPPRIEYIRGKKCQVSHSKLKHTACDSELSDNGKGAHVARQQDRRYIINTRQSRIDPSSREIKDSTKQGLCAEVRAAVIDLAQPGFHILRYRPRAPKSISLESVRVVDLHLKSQTH